MLRLGALVIAVFPVALVLAVRGPVWVPWLGAGLALLLGLILARARPDANNLVMFGALLAAAAGLAAPEATWPGRAVPLFDLRTLDSGDALHGDIQIQGFLRNDLTIDEYVVPEGGLPRQDELGRAVLVPLLPHPQDPASLSDFVVVARVTPDRVSATAVQTLRGHARPLEPELLSTFLQAAGVQPPPGLRGVLLDTLDTRAQQAWVRALLIGLGLLGALACLLLAVRRPPAASSPPSSA